MNRLALLSTVALLAACSPEPVREPEAIAVDKPAAVASDTPTPDSTPAPITGRAHRYTSLEDCKLVREEREEMPYSEVLCAGPAGWALRIADADARQTLSVVAPDGDETRIDLSRVSGGAFNSFGRTAEWRGAAADPFQPDSLIVRFNVAEQPSPAPEASYLLAIRLVPAPCLVVRVAPGPDQNDLARAAAAPDDRHVCPR